GAERGRGNDRCPVQKRMKALREDLRGHQYDQRPKKNCLSDEVAPVQRHRDGVAACFTERRGSNLDDPEDESDFGDFCQGVAWHLGLVSWHCFTLRCILTTADCTVLFLES